MYYIFMMWERWYGCLCSFSGRLGCLQVVDELRNSYLEAASRCGAFSLYIVDVICFSYGRIGDISLTDSARDIRRFA